MISLTNKFTEILLEKQEDKNDMLNEMNKKLRKD